MNVNLYNFNIYEMSCYLLISISDFLFFFVKLEVIISQQFKEEVEGGKHSYSGKFDTNNMHNFILFYFIIQEGDIVIC